MYFEFHYSEVPNRRADRNKRAGLKKVPTCLLIYYANNKRAGGNSSFITWKIVSRVERKSENSKWACSSIRDFRVFEGQLILKCSFGFLQIDQKTNEIFVRISALASKKRSNQVV